VNSHERYTCFLDRDEDGLIRRVHLEAIDLEGHGRSVSVDGRRVTRIVEAVHEVLHRGGVPVREWGGRRPITLQGGAGSHLELLLRAVRPLRRGDRLARIADAIAQMSVEEAAYWHAKSHRVGGLAALRLLLQGGHR
jgi:hypothetical protein